MRNPCDTCEELQGLVKRGLLALESAKYVAKGKIRCCSECHQGAGGDTDDQPFYSIPSRRKQNGTLVREAALAF